MKRENGRERIDEVADERASCIYPFGPEIVWVVCVSKEDSVGMRA